MDNYSLFIWVVVLGAAVITIVKILSPGTNGTKASNESAINATSDAIIRANDINDPGLPRTPAVAKKPLAFALRQAATSGPPSQQRRWHRCHVLTQNRVWLPAIQSFADDRHDLAARDRARVVKPRWGGPAIQGWIEVRP